MLRLWRGLCGLRGPMDAQLRQLLALDELRGLRCGALSGGMSRRVSLAMALCARYEKDRAGAGRLLELFCQVCAWALRDPAAPLPAALAARALPLAQRAAGQLRANVSAKLALAVFAVRACAPAGGGPRA